MIAVCGFRNSYRIILKGERLIRRKIRRPSSIVEGYDSFPRYFIRRVFRAGLVIAMRWEGRAKNAAQMAADARMRARSAQKAVSSRVEQARHRAEDVRAQAQDQAAAMREHAARARQRAEDVRTKARESADRIRDTAASARKRADDLRATASESAERMRGRAADARQKAAQVRDAAVKAKEAAFAAKDRVVEIKNRVRERVSPAKAAEVGEVKKIEGNGQAQGRKRKDSSTCEKRTFHSRGLAEVGEPEKRLLVRTRIL
ncbi:unnamed protein product [Chondrus crispus]|uniref:Uncharacterized protein n=1 Tax=Chondrus crispus TaxID=2769 RepID=R7QKR1_CHOCR|nr:unnamed protein product [Chondrus crispus]CDF38363.1 unnamed protein product [Chondrus crispus]|eukprot:XP_005718248.1 unnamed protein product [Chondrus crispus]